MRRGVAEIISETEFRRLLGTGKPLRLKMGFDPSRPDIHLGHVVGLRKLRQLQDLGHQVVLIVGDWTARIGDPSGHSVTRPMLTESEVKANAETYMKQFFKVVDKEKTEVAWQSQWFDKFTLADIIRLASKFTVAQFLAREDFRKRYDASQPLGVHELLYPLLQAYDSIAVRSDVEFGGTDQKFNLLVGRELQDMMGQTPQQCFLVPILVGTDGSLKMSKSLGNYIAIGEPPEEMYGKIMSIPDGLILLYFELLTDVSDEALAEFRRQLAEKSVNPMALKQRLAREVVAQFHGGEAGRHAEEHFNKVFREERLPEKIEEIRVSYKLIAATTGVPSSEEGTSRRGSAPMAVPATELYSVPLVDIDWLLTSQGVVKSKGEAKRLRMQGAVEMNGKVVKEARVALEDGAICRIGKRRFIRIVNTDAHKGKR